jgi:hypothetical protein
MTRYHCYRCYRFPRGREHIASHALDLATSMITVISRRRRCSQHRLPCARLPSVAPEQCPLSAPAGRFGGGEEVRLASKLSIRTQRPGQHLGQFLQSRGLGQPFQQSLSP